MVEAHGHLHRATDRTGQRRAASQRRFRFVNVATIESPEEWQRAVTAPGFPGDEQPGVRHPSLYELVRDHEPTQPGELVLIAPFEVATANDEAFTPTARTSFGSYPALYEVVAR